MRSRLQTSARHPSPAHVEPSETPDNSERHRLEHGPHAERGDLRLATGATSMALSRSDSAGSGLEAKESGSPLTLCEDPRASSCPSAGRS
jgi:hypothetical protein